MWNFRRMATTAITSSISPAAFLMRMGGLLADSEETPRRAELGERAYAIELREIEESLTAFGVHFDTWFSERELHLNGAVEDRVKELLDSGLAYEEEGAVWMRTSSWGDDKDRVLVRQNGSPTYFASDIAYHMNKIDRGYEHLINIWGADHHGYIARMQAALTAQGHPGILEIILGQLVNLKRGRGTGTNVKADGGTRNLRRTPG